MAKRALNLVDLQNRANAYAQLVVQQTNFQLGDLDEDNFKASMHAIMQALVSAWAAGFAAGRESK
jgi:hypothetical protein